jgi:poly(3-hydroxybutyrate) depolymerase/lysophospholipase L1-like esterase
MTSTRSLLLPLLALAPLFASAAEPAAAPSPFAKWEKDMAAFEAQDRANPPAPGGILFAGASSIRMWKSLAEDLPGYTILNRGFGGSQIAENTHFAPRIALPYRPRLILLNAGGNDLNAGCTPARVLADFQEYVRVVRAALPEVRLLFLSINPSPARWAQVEKQKEANALVKAWMDTQSNMVYLDVFEPSLDAGGQPRAELFVADRLHPSAAGYRLRADLIRPHLGAPGAGSDLAAAFEARVFSGANGGQLAYRLLKPVGYDASRRYPLVLFLHGAGERGSNNVAQLKHGLRGFAAPEFQARQPVFVMAPQVPLEQKWSNTDWNAPKSELPGQPASALRLAMDALAALQEEFRIDADRIYVTGLSMGGYGTWDAICRYPGYFAAAVPVCGGGDEAKVAVVKDLPIWCFHGDQDKAVPVARSRNMIEAIRRAGGQPRYTEYPNVGHNSWDNAYGDPALYEWLFAQRRPAK